MFGPPQLRVHGAPWDALEQSGTHKSTHAPEFELQFWYLVRGIATGGRGFLQVVFSRYLNFGTHATGSRGDTY